jgi:hypothetical protein
MTAAIKGTFPVKKREHNGLEAIAAQVNGDRLSRVYVVAVVEWHAHRETANDDVVTFNIAAIEPACDDNLTENADTAALRRMLDKLRKQRGKSNVAETLFSMPPAGADDQLPGQTTIDDHTEVRDGRVIPEASAEEEMAERAEAKDAASGDTKSRKGVAAASKPAPVTFAPGTSAS